MATATQQEQVTQEVWGVAVAVNGRASGREYRSESHARFVYGELCGLYGAESVSLLWYPNGIAGEAQEL